MPNEPQTAGAALDQGLRELTQLRQFAGPPKDFWPRFLAVARQVSLADTLVLLARKPGQAWQQLLSWPRETLPSRMLTTFLTQLEQHATRTAAENWLLWPLEEKARSTSGHFVVGARLDAQPGQAEECVLVGLISEISEANAREASVRLRLLAPAPQLYQTALAARQARGEAEKLATVLDLTASISPEKRFLAAAMTFCNGLASRYGCDQVSLGWLEGGYVRLRAMSRTEKFERQMAAAQALEAAMEESLDQDDEVVWPRPEGTALVSREHERFCREQKVEHMWSLPLRVDKQPVAVISCERRGPGLSETELQQMRLACDLAAPFLERLHKQDRWFGARWAAHARDGLARLLGPEHTWAKLLALVVTALLGVLFLVPVPYRVEGKFVLRSEAQASLTAPFDGFLEQALVRPGDTVRAGSELLKLRTDELALEESFALADVDRYQREAEKARAAKALAEMRIAQAMAEQATARLELVRYRIAHATIKSPFEGVVIEGDLRERLGAPVKAAEVLLKIARIDTLYAEAEVNERDIHEVLGKAAGQIAFVSQPKKKFPIRIAALEQAALPRNEANVFLVRCRLGPPQPWWRPGMSGVCKIDVDKRTLFWILTHRTVDFLRLHFWW